MPLSRFDQIAPEMRTRERLVPSVYPTG